MIQTTRWSPDTCKCVIEMNWDDAVSEDQRQHTLKEIKKCPAHFGISDVQAYKDVLDENQSKNRAIGLMLKTHPRLQGKEGDFKHSFDAERNVVIETDLLTADEKTQLNLLPKTEIKKKVTFK